MSIEFVDQDPPPVPADGRPDADGTTSDATPARPGSRRFGRLLALVWVVAALLTAGATMGTTYQLRQTSYVVDFDHTSAEVYRVDVDAFGHFHVPTTLAAGVGISYDDGPAYGTGWLGLAAALLALAVWQFVRPTSLRPPLVATVLGALLVGNLASIWLLLHSGTTNPAANITFAQVPLAGYWLATAGGVITLVAGLAASLSSAAARPGSVRSWSVNAVALARRAVTGRG